MLVFFCSRFIAYDHPMEGVVYGQLLASALRPMKFFYLASNLDHWKTIAIMRGLLTVQSMALWCYHRHLRRLGAVRRSASPWPQLSN